MSDIDNEGEVAGRRLSLVERAARRLTDQGVAAATPATRKTPAKPMAAQRPPVPVAPSPDEAADAEAQKGGKFVHLNLDALTARHVLTPRGERSRMAEEYRSIKRPLLQYARASFKKPELKGNLIMVTSAIPGEGKTFTTVNLAMSIAKERDLNVLLIDADLSRPSLASRLGIEESLGLTDLLEDPSLDVSQVLQRTNIRNLSLITAGRPHTMGTELLASRRAETVINELARRYPDRIILFDTSPIQATNEGGALATEVGQVILIVEAERTTEMEIKGALEMLSVCPNVMLLLNKTKTRFGRYYGTYYGTYYGQDAEQA
jgi:receptor protein-tyrosine kinase